MIKAVIFDIGGVILDMEKLSSPIKEIFNPSDMTAFWQEVNEKFSPLCRGEGTLLDFWKKFAKEKKNNISEVELKKRMIDNFGKHLFIDKEVKKIIVSLKKKYKLGIISNTIKEHVDELKKVKEFREVESFFDVIILSYKVKMTKEKKDIFLLALKELGLKPEECVFTDDTKKFVGVAKSLGIKAIQFKTAEQFKKDLKKLGVKV
jgi:epoxide hydrolase-like predicted phosphatase